jgi:N-acetylmuramoyl-L-alanine amidase
MKWMHSFGNCVIAVLVVLAPVDVRAQADLKVDTTGKPAVRDVAPIRSAAATGYEALLEQEQRVLQSPAATADDFRVVINRYWTFVRRYATNGYADNALWQAANLSAESFARFNQERDKYRALQLYQWLRDQYPHSSLRAQTSARIEQLESISATAPAAAATSPSTPAAPAAADSTIRAVHREVLPDVVRVTVELDREVVFYQERIERPSRLFFDLKGTKTVASLVDATFRYDSDIVRHIRLGRHPNSTTRVVIDLENVARYSVFTLYNPYRIVIDAERAMTPSTPAPQIAKARQTPAFLPSRQIAALRTGPPPVLTPPARIVLLASAAPVAPVAPIAPVAPVAPTVITAKPLPPSANSSGKFSVARQLGLGVSRIVIDAGHGGHDPGASASGISEAELVLDVTLRLEKLLLQQPGTEVVLTRRTNDFVSLEERTELANRESADLFLSIHANASANASARGVETYFLNFALNPQAEAVAARENAASGKTMSSLPGIIKAITLNSKLNESRDFAASIQRSLVRGMRGGNKTLRDLGVKQAPFVVLIGASMPSVLAEISFVTNPEEARLLKLPGYRQRIAESLLAGILRYQQSLKKVQTAAALGEARN